MNFSFIIRLLLILSLVLLAKAGPIEENPNEVNSLKDLCENEEGIFFSNENSYICLVKPNLLYPQSSINILFIGNTIVYHDKYYTPSKKYTHIDYVELYEYYTKIAELLNVNIDTLVPYKSFIDAMKEYFKFMSTSCTLYYEKENSYACFGLSLVPDDEDLNSLISNHRVVKDGKFYYLTESSFICEKGDFSCYDRIAYVMDVDVDSILPKENMETTIDIERSCESESGGLFYYISTGVNYVCLRKYQEQEEADIPENSVCFLDENNVIYCVKEQYTEIEACKKENEKFDYETCRKTVEGTVMSKIFYEYPSNGKSIKTITSLAQSRYSGYTTSKTIPYSYLSSINPSPSLSSKQLSSPSPSSKQLPSPSSSSSTSSSKTVPILTPTIISYDIPEASLCRYRKDDIATSYYITIEGDSESTDKQALLELVNDRMNEIYDIIYKNREIYRDYCNNDIDEELDTAYPEGTKFLFVDELKQGTNTSYDDFIPLKSSLIKVGDYLTREEDGCSATASSGCHTIYAYLTENMVEGVKKLPNIVKMEKSNVYSYITIKNDRAPKTTPLPKTLPVETIGSSKQLPISSNVVPFIPLTVSTKNVLDITTTKTIPLTTKQIQETFSTEEIPLTNNVKEIPVTASAKEVPVTTSKCLPVTVTTKVTETETIKVKETVTVTVTI